MFTTRFEAWVRRHAERLMSALGRLPVTPNQITVVGTAFTFLAAVLAAFGQLRWAGVVLLEAMACALPVVATEVPGYMSVLEPGKDSLTVRPKSWAELGAALVILARDPELRRRMGAAGFEKAKQYSWSSVATQVIEVYEEARAAARGSVESHVHDAV